MCLTQISTGGTEWLQLRARGMPWEKGYAWKVMHCYKGRLYPIIQHLSTVPRRQRSYLIDRWVDYKYFTRKDYTPNLSLYPNESIHVIPFDRYTAAKELAFFYHDTVIVLVEYKHLVGIGYCEVASQRTMLVKKVRVCLGWHTAQRKMLDVDSGWQYGFPKEIPWDILNKENKLSAIKEWLEPFDLPEHVHLCYRILPLIKRC